MTKIPFLRRLSLNVAFAIYVLIGLWKFAETFSYILKGQTSFMSHFSVLCCCVVLWWTFFGQTSLKGSVTAVVGDKVVHYQASLKHCKGCMMWKIKEGTPTFDKWSYQGQSSDRKWRQPAVQKDVFSISFEKQFDIQWKHNKYLGDRDTFLFKFSLIYPDDDDFLATHLYNLVMYGRHRTLTKLSIP